MATYTTPVGVTTVTFADATSQLSTNANDIAALETEVGDYTGGGGAEASIAAGLVAAEANIGTPATISTETDLFAICAALEARIVTLETP